MSTPSMEQMFPTPNHLLIPNKRRNSMTGKAKVTNSMTGKAKVAKQGWLRSRCTPIRNMLFPKIDR